MDCSLPGSSVHGILQARILEWVTIPFSRGVSSQPRDRTDLLLCRQILCHLSQQGNPKRDKSFVPNIFIKRVLTEDFSDEI